MINLSKLKEFILLANHATYASGDQNIKQIQPDKSTTITYSNPSFKHYFFHDNYFGGEPYGGREVIFFNKKPVWIMVYYGWVKQGQNADTIYAVLMAALKESSVEMPYRGPEMFVQKDYKYTNIVSGDVKNFSGHEKIFYKDSIVYEAKYQGGLVDQ